DFLNNIYSISLVAIVILVDFTQTIIFFIIIIIVITFMRDSIE
uniref:Uncharacterized protein n=2 Tax=Amphimedon queenslandica TaxID=400682 RepID=A0A1X7SE30_AMPQE